MVRRGLGFAALLVGAAAAACTPVTQYRYTAFTPSARPMNWDGRVARAGSLRLEGAAASTNVVENLAPQLHDTALLIPSLTFEGSVMLALTSKVELGLHGAWASYDSAQESAVGTMPVPGAPPTWGAGPEIRIAIPLADRDRFVLGIGMNALDMGVTYAEWELTPGCTPSPTCVSGSGAGSPRYQLHATNSETHWMMTFALLPSYAFGDHGEYGHVFGGITATSGFSNDGFTDTHSNGSTVDTFWPLWIASLGYGYQVDVLRMSAQLFKPLTSAGSPVNYGFGGMLTIGVAVPLWESNTKN